MVAHREPLHVNVIDAHWPAKSLVATFFYGFLLELFLFDSNCIAHEGHTGEILRPIHDCDLFRMELLLLAIVECFQRSFCHEGDQAFEGFLIDKAVQKAIVWTKCTYLQQHIALAGLLYQLRDK